MATPDRKDHQMLTTMTQLAAREHGADLRRAARGRNRVDATDPRIEIRLAGAEDAVTVNRLAALDEAPEIAGPALLGLFDGEPVAALSLRDGRSVADPFVLTQNIVALLQLRARHMAHLPGHRRLQRRMRSRFA